MVENAPDTGLADSDFRLKEKRFQYNLFKSFISYKVYLIYLNLQVLDPLG